MRYRASDPVFGQNRILIPANQYLFGEPGPETSGPSPPDREKAELETGCSADTGTDPAINRG